MEKLPDSEYNSILDFLPDRAVNALLSSSSGMNRRTKDITSTDYYWMRKIAELFDIADYTKLVLPTGSSPEDVYKHALEAISNDPDLQTKDKQLMFNNAKRGKKHIRIIGNVWSDEVPRIATGYGTPNILIMQLLLDNGLAQQS